MNNETDSLMMKDEKLREMKEQMLEKRIKSLEDYQGRQQVMMEQETQKATLFPKTINLVEDYKQSTKTLDYPHMQSFGRRDR
jgi:signal transduction protein with GAF and PtsI domain